MDVVYFLVVLILGLVVAFFSYRIFYLTQGGSKGWMYIAIVGMAMAFWSISQMVYDIMQLSEEFRIVLGTIMFLAISFLAPTAVFRLIEDMSLVAPKLFARRNFNIAYLFIFFILVLYNLMGARVNVLSEIYSASQFMLLVGFMPMTYGMCFVWKGTRKPAWLLMIVFGILMSAAQVPSIYMGACCGEGGALASDTVCSGYDIPYTETVPTHCTEDMVLLVKDYRVIDIFSFLIALIAFFLLWWSMESASRH